jgi:hypothetical protein
MTARIWEDFEVIDMITTFAVAWVLVSTGDTSMAPLLAITSLFDSIGWITLAANIRRN